MYKFDLLRLKHRPRDFHTSDFLKFIPKPEMK
jgi:hypothetical protein